MTVILIFKAVFYPDTLGFRRGAAGTGGLVMAVASTGCICKQSAPTPHHSIFTGCMLFLTPNQGCQSIKAKEKKRLLRGKSNPVFHNHLDRN